MLMKEMGIKLAILGVLLGTTTAQAGLKVYYVRHAQGGHNVKKDWEKRGVPKAEWPAYVGNPNIFTPQGEKEQATVAGKLKGLKFDFVASSPLWRCRNTILPYMKEVGLKGEIWPELAEFPDRAAGILSPNLPAPTSPVLGAGGPVRLPASEAAYFSLRANGQRGFKLPPRGEKEAREAAIQLVQQSVVEMIQTRFGGTDKSIILAGHGNAGKILLKWISKNELKGFRSISNAGIWMVEEQKDGSFKIMMYNNVPLTNEKPPKR